jgi:hypothetical protein
MAQLTLSVTDRGNLNAIYTLIQLELLSSREFRKTKHLIQFRCAPLNRLTHRNQRLAEFRYRLRGFLKFSEHEAAKIGLNPQQHQALLAIKGTERLGIRHNSAVQLITAKSEGPSKEPRVHA